MLIVTDVLGNSEIINKFNNFEMNQELDGNFTLSFLSYVHPDNPGHDLIVQEGFVEYDGYKFRIKQLTKHTSSINVSCISSYYDIINSWKYDIFGGTHTLGEFLTWVLSDTGWSWDSENIDINQSKLIPNFGQNNTIRLMDALKIEFGFEMGIGRNNIITISDELGPDNDAQYRYSHNVVSVTESIDTTNLRTYIEGFGANGIHVTYTSPYAENPGIGIRHADPIYDEEFTEPDKLLEFIQNELYDHPDSIVELDDAVLMDKELGERVWLIHERMGFEYQTRVLSKSIRIPSSKSTVTLGTILPKSRSISSSLAEQKVTINDNNKKHTSRIHQTNERIELAVARLDGADADLQASIIIEADRISQEVIDRTSDVTTLQANLIIEADRITTEVSERQNGDINTRTYVEQTATSIRSEVSTDIQRLDGSIDSSNSLISQNASEILLRVRRDGVVSSINQTPESVRIMASKINLVGAVTFSDLDYGMAGYVGDGLTAKSRTDDWIDPFTTRIKGSAISTGDFTALNSITLGSQDVTPKALIMYNQNGLAAKISSYNNDWSPGLYLSAGKVVADSLYVGTPNASSRVLTTADSVIAKFG